MTYSLTKNNTWNVIKKKDSLFDFKTFWKLNHVICSLNLFSSLHIYDKLNLLAGIFGKLNLKCIFLFFLKKKMKM